MSNYQVGQEVWIRAVVDYVGKDSLDVIMSNEWNTRMYIEGVGLDDVVPGKPDKPKGKALVEYDLETGKVISIHMKGEEEL